MRPALAISTVTVFITTYLWMVYNPVLWVMDGRMLGHLKYGSGIRYFVVSSWQWQLVLATIALAVLFIHQRYIRNFSLLIVASIMLILHAFIGHGAMFTGSEAIFYKVNQSIHLISAAYWFGGYGHLSLVCSFT